MYGHLSTYLQKVIIDNSVNTNTPLYNALRSIPIIIGSASGIPFISAAKKAAFGNAFLEYYFATSTVISFGVGSAWAWYKVSEELAPASQDDLALKLQTKYRNLRIASAMIIGLLVSLPSAYSAYKYNDNSLLFAMMTLLSGYGLHAYANFKAIGSINAFTVAAKSYRKPDKREYWLLVLQRKLSARIAMEKDRILAMNDEDKRAYLLDLVSSDPETFIHKVIEAKAGFPPRYKHERGYILTDYFCNNILSIVFPLVFGYVNFLLVSDGAQLVSDNLAFAIIIGCLSVIPFLFLEAIASRKIFGNIFNSCYSRMRGAGNPSEISNYMPKWAASCLGALIVLIAIGASSSRFFISYDTSADTSLFFPLMTFLGGCIFQLYSNLDSAVLISRKASATVGSGSKKSTAEMLYKLSKLEAILTAMPVEVFQQVLEGINSDRLRETIKITCQPHKTIFAPTSEATPLLPTTPRRQSETGLEITTALTFSRGRSKSLPLPATTLAQNPDVLLSV